MSTGTVVGMLVAHLIKPGVGLNIDPATPTEDHLDLRARTGEYRFVTRLLTIIPDTFVEALCTGTCSRSCYSQS